MSCVENTSYQFAIELSSHTYSPPDKSFKLQYVFPNNTSYKNTQPTHHDQIPKQCSHLPNLHSQRPRIDAVYPRHIILLKPSRQALVRGPMGMFPRVATYDQTRNVNFPRFEKFGKVVLVRDIVVGDAVVPDEGEGKYQYLAAVGWVGEGFGVADHAGVEYHLALA